MRITTAFVNESSKRELIRYDIDSSKVTMLMQQEGIKVNASPLKAAPTVELFNEYDRAFYAGNSTDTIVYHSKETNRIAVMSNEFAQLMFVYNQDVSSVLDIKSIVDNMLQPSKHWKVYEVVY